MPDAIPTLVRSFNREWEPYYGPSGPGDAERDLTACCQRGALPLALVALDAGGNAVGTAALKPHSLKTHRHLGPWLATLWVAPDRRGEGIASALITAIEARAKQLGFAALYSDTAAGSTLLRRRGWKKLAEDIPTLREPATLYRWSLKPDEN